MGKQAGSEYVEGLSSEITDSTLEIPIVGQFNGKSNVQDGLNVPFDMVEQAIRETEQYANSPAVKAKQQTIQEMKQAVPILGDIAAAVYSLFPAEWNYVPQ